VTGDGTTGSLPKGISISPDGARLYVTNYGQRNHRNVSVFDAATLHRLSEIHVPGIVVESVVSPDGNTLYLSNFTRGSVQVVDLATGAVRLEIPTTGRNPKIVVLSPDGRRLFAANWSSRNVTEIDTSTGIVTRTLAAGTNPRGMAVARDGTLYVANFSDHSMEVYSGASMEHHVHVSRLCRVPRHLVLAPDDSMLYVSCMGQSTVVGVDPATLRIVHSVRVGSAPKAIDVCPGGRYLFTANYGGHGISLVDVSDWSARTLEIPGADHTSGVVCARSGLRAFVTGWYDYHVYAVEPEGVVPALVFSSERLRDVDRLREYHRQHPVE